MQMKSDKGHGKQEKERESHTLCVGNSIFHAFCRQQGVKRGLTKTHFQ